MTSVWIWQQMISPHMMPLAQALAGRGVDVRFLANEEMSPQRRMQGWSADTGHGVDIRLIRHADEISAQVAQSPTDTIHLTEGIVRNGIIGVAQKLLSARGARIWWMAETVDQRGVKGWLKAADYRRAIARRSSEAECLLAIGANAENFFGNCGLAPEKIRPFAYFLNASADKKIERPEGPFRIMFAARMIGLKRLDLLVNALSFVDRPFVLDIVGEGPRAGEWRAIAESVLGARMTWHGTATPAHVRRLLRRSDLLVSPSDYDGWGAVLSEAMIEGTRAICSDACGAARVVALGGATFPAGDRQTLSSLIEAEIERGPVASEERSERQRWAYCLTADAGADYLLQLIENRSAYPPWRLARPLGRAA